MSLRPLSALERYLCLGIVPVMAGGSEGATEAGGAEGEGAQPSGLYQEALSGVPQDLHPFVEEHFKKWDSNVTPKLQEAAQLREKFGPLAEIEGLTDVPADELRELIEFRSILGDPEQLKSWLTEVNQAVGLNTGELDQQSWEALGEENGWFDDGEGGGSEVDPQSIAQQVLELLQPELDPLKKYIGTQEQSQAAEQVKTEIVQTMQALEAKHGELDDDKRDVVYRLSASYPDESPSEAITKAFQDFLKITGEAEGRAVDGKLEQPNGSLSGGRPSTEAPHTSWQQGNGNVNPKDIALRRFQQA